jgi:hypothetical protein
MNETLKRVLALALLACVMFIVIHPTFDLPDSTVRSKAALMVLVCAMVVASFCAKRFFSSAFGLVMAHALPEPLDSGRSTLSALRC